jgi:internalin A
MKRTHRAWAAAAILLILLIGGNLSADEAEDKAVQAVEKLGGKVARDERAQGKPVVVVDLERTKAMDKGLKQLVGLKRLRHLALDYTAVTDAGLKEVAAFKQLQLLGLHGTKVTDKGLKELVALKDLKDLIVSRTGVTNRGVAELQKALPKCRIVTD